MNKSIKQKGVVTLRIIDTTTGAVRTITKNNRLFNLSGAMTNAAKGLTTISLLLTDVSSGIGALVGFRLYGGQELYTTNNFTNVVGPWYYEKKQRMLSTGADRQIYGVVISGNAVDSTVIGGMVILDEPVTQGANEVIDVVYRIIYEDAGLGMLDRGMLLQALRLFYNADATGTRSYLWLNNVAITDNLQHWGELGHAASMDFYNTVGATSTYFYANWALAKAQSTTKNIRSLCVAKNSVSGLPRNPASGSINHIYNYTPLLNDKALYTNWPVGPMYNHSATNNIWMEELEELASGSGYPSARKTDATYMSDTFACQQHVITITESGDVGASKYYHSCMRVDGNIYNKYGMGTNVSLPTLSTSARPATSRNYPHITQPDPFGPSPQSSSLLNTRAYNSQTLLLKDFTDRLGFAIINVFNHEYHYFDDQTSPGLPSGSPNIELLQVSRSTTGSIYIPTGNNGLTTIQNPLNSPSITTTNLVSMGVSTPVSGVGCDMNDRILIHTGEGISYSVDGGTTWINKGPWTYSGDPIVGTGSIGVSTVQIVINPLDPDEIAINFKVDGLWYATWYDINSNHVTAPASYATTRLYNSGEVLFVEPTRGIWHFASLVDNDSQGYIAYGAITTNTDYDEISSATSFSLGHRIYDKLGNPLLLKGVVDQNNLTLFTPGGESHGNLSIEIWKSTSLNYRIHYDVYDGIPMNESGLNLFLTRDEPAAIYSACEIEALRPDTSLSTTYQQEDIYNSASAFPLDEPGIYRECMGYHEIHRWDSNTATWRDKREWSIDAVATADGSSSAGGKRVNFKHDSNSFDGRSYLDITDALSGVNFSTSGLTVLATYTPSVKQVNTKTSNRRSALYPSGEGYTHTCFDLYDSTTGSGIVFMWRNLDSNIVLIDYTVPATPVENVIRVSSSEGEFRIAVALSGNGSTASVYIDGLQIGSNITLTAPLNIDNTGDHLSLVMGSRQRFYPDNKPFYYDIFKGDITNIQLWGRQLVPVEISTDNSDHTGLISGSSLVVRYEMTASIIETRATSPVEQTAPYGYIHHFQTGTGANPDYVAGESYNAIVSRDSVVKGNVVDLGGYIEDIPHGETIEMPTSPIDGTNTIPASDAYVRIPISWSNYVGNMTVGGVVFHSNAASTAYMDQASDGDITIDYELAFGLDGHYTQVKLIPTNNPTVPIAVIQHKFGDDIVVVFQNSADNITIPFVYASGKRWKMAYNRAASTVSVYSDIGSGYVQHGTTVAVPLTTATVTFSVYMNVATTSSSAVLLYSGSHSGIVDAHVTSLCKRTILYLGDYTTKTAYHRIKMTALPVVMRDRLVFYADGVPLTLNVISSGVPGSLWATSTTPGNVYISPLFGGLLFDDSDVGKVITCDPISIPKPASD